MEKDNPVICKQEAQWALSRSPEKNVWHVHLHNIW